MSAWVDVAVGVSASATALSILGTVAVKLAGRSIRNMVGGQLDVKLEPVVQAVNERFDANDHKTAAAVEAIEEVRAEQREVKLNLATQFGGNGGGMRQAINELNVAVGGVRGAFEQHLREVGNRKE